MTDGQLIRLAGQGEQATGGGRSGDLYLEVHIRPHRLFQLEGRDVTLTLTPQPGTPAGNVPFTVIATSTTTSSVTATAAGTLTVVDTGVNVSLNPTAVAPGGTLAMTVTNTGTVPDTFDLSLGGPAALVASLAAGKVTLAAGASQVISIQTQAVNFAVPGALEIPAALAMALDAMDNDRVNYDGFIALGCVIRGETTHYETVAGESARALMDLAVADGLALGNGILTVENDEQAYARARVAEGNKGGTTAEATLAMIALRARFGLDA